jgi:hypothetical protein
VCVGTARSFWVLVRADRELESMTARVSTGPDHGWQPGLEIIFSCRDGYVWASWQDSEVSVRLGRHDMVAAMMQDFLAQDALGQRLATRYSNKSR